MAGLSNATPSSSSRRKTRWAGVGSPIAIFQEVEMRPYTITCVPTSTTRSLGMREYSVVSSARPASQIEEPPCQRGISGSRWRRTPTSVPSLSKGGPRLRARSGEGETRFENLASLDRSASIQPELIPDDPIPGFARDVRHTRRCSALPLHAANPPEIDISYL